MVSLPTPSFDAPKLFPEILDLIVEEVANIEFPKDRKHALSAMALTSRRLRRPAQKHIFEKICLRDIIWEPCIPAAHELCAVMEADPQSEFTGAVPFIRSFEFDLAGSAEDLIPAVNDGALATIMRKLFKSREDEHPGSRTYSFGLSLEQPPPAWFESDTVFDWQQPRPDFLVAFSEMLR